MEFKEHKSSLIHNINSKLKIALQKTQKSNDDIFGFTQINHNQLDEIKIREKIAKTIHYNPLKSIANHHSIPVMDFEVTRFLTLIPKNGLILDIGGCWGWHWRNLQKIRPDLNVVIVDFIRGNLLHAKNLLKDFLNKSVFLMHSDATRLNLPNCVFDGVWTVQTLQHIPSFLIAVSEAKRVLKPNGVFANYSLNIQPHIRFIKSLLGKKYLISGRSDNGFWLSRASREQKMIIEKIFENKVTERWSEILYSPELGFSYPGVAGNWLGRIDAILSNNNGIFKCLARQHSFHVRKP